MHDEFDTTCAHVMNNTFIIDFVCYSYTFDHFHIDILT